MERCKEINFKSAASLVLVTFVIFLALSCAIYRGPLTMGSVIGTLNSSVYLDIQSKYGASVGQELNVYKVIMNPQEPLASSASKGVQSGKVKITEIFDNRIAKAVLISGKAEKGDIVELTGR